MFFSSAGRIHPRFKTPALAILIQGGWSVVLAASGTYEQLFTYVIFSGWIFYGAAAFALVVLRRQLPGLERPYRVWGYPVLPAAFALAVFAIVANTLVGRPREAWIGLALVLTGVPIYFAWKRLARRGGLALPEQGLSSS